MEPNQFVAEVYRRMQLRTSAIPFQLPPDARVEEVIREYKQFLPQDKSAPMIDIGFGFGSFMLACRKLGYTDVHGADFGIEHKAALRDHGITLHEIKTNIGDFLAEQPERYDFIHMSHVIEHIPSIRSFGWQMGCIAPSDVGDIVPANAEYGRPHCQFFLLCNSGARVWFRRIEFGIFVGDLWV